MIVNISQFIRY